MVHSFDGHTRNVCSVLFHPKLSIIVSASEDGTCRIWQSATYRAAATVNYGMERAWSLSACPDLNKLAIGFDKGCVCVELESVDPDSLMDGTSNEVWVMNNETKTGAARRTARLGDTTIDGGGQRVRGGACELPPPARLHDDKENFGAACGNEFTIQTPKALQRSIRHPRRRFPGGPRLRITWRVMVPLVIFIHFMLFNQAVLPGSQYFNSVWVTLMGKDLIWVDRFVSPNPEGEYLYLRGGAAVGLMNKVF
jgi:WD domain, G-beta repeat